MKPGQYESQSQVVCGSQVLDLKLHGLGLSGQSAIFGFSCHHCKHFLDFLAHVLSWVKTYDHVRFQRNLPTGLARMMVQTYKQTDIYFYVYRCDVCICMCVYMYVCLQLWHCSCT